MPKLNEWKLIGAQIDIVSKGQSESGLMLCDKDSGYSSAQCKTAVVCSGSYDDSCYVRYVWSQRVSASSSNALYFRLEDGVLVGQYSGNVSYAFSARCISEL